MTTRLNSFSAAALILLVGETVLLYGCYLAAAYLTRMSDMELYLLYDNGLLQIAIVVVILQIGLYYQLLYETLLPRSRILLIQQLCLVLGFAFLLQSVMGYTNWMVQLPKWTMIYGSLLVLLLLPVWRMAYSALTKAVPAKQVLFLGGTAVVGDLAAILRARQSQGMSVVGYLDEGSQDVSSVPRLGGIEDIDQVIRTHRPDRIVTALSGSRKRLPTRLLLDLQLSGIQIEEATSLYESITGRISVRDLVPSQLIFSSVFDPQTANVGLKTFYSLVLGAAATIAALPVLAVAALLMKVSSPGPVLLRRKCVGSGGASFDLYTFRPAQTLTGRWLRRLHLERLPQLFNIVRGDMSIVGPKPERLEFAAVLEAQIPFYRQRYCLKPGITGWAQINFKGHAGIEDAIAKLEYDLYYIKNMSPALDAYIVLHSFTST